MLSIPRTVARRTGRQDAEPVRRDNHHGAPGDASKGPVRAGAHVVERSGTARVLVFNIGANQILIIRTINDPAANLESRMAMLKSKDPFGVDEFSDRHDDGYICRLRFSAADAARSVGPCFEVRSYILKGGGLAPTSELWAKAVPARNRISPVLTAMTSVTGAVTRFTHIWPYKSLDERARLRAKAADEGGFWPPPGGPDQIAAQQVDIFFPARRSHRSAEDDRNRLVSIRSRRPCPSIATA